MSVWTKEQLDLSAATARVIHARSRVVKLAIKLAVQLVLILWWACQLTVHYSVRGVRRIRANHQQWQTLNQSGDTVNVEWPRAARGVPVAWDLGRDPTGTWEPTAGSAIDLARAAQRGAHT